MKEKTSHPSLTGSLTVEAAVVLPLFLFFFLNLLSSVEMIRLQGNLSQALWVAGRDLSLYAGAMSDSINSLPETGHKGTLKKENDDMEENVGITIDETKEDNHFFADMALSYGYVKTRIVNYLGQDYLNASPLKKGTKSLVFLESNILNEGDVIDIVLTYEVSPAYQIPKLFRFRLANRYYGHIWSGYGKSSSIDEIRKDETIVYITNNSEVYHLTTSCTNLSLKVKGVSKDQVKYERSNDGSKYYACEYCGLGTMPETLYIATEGLKYHYQRDCQGLKRTYSAVLLKDVESDHRPCSRCGGG